VAGEIVVLTALSESRAQPWQLIGLKRAR